jgi:hypothetical protein
MMKTRILTLLLAIALAPVMNAQSEFEGSINYDITYLSLPDELKEMEAMLPKSVTKYYKGSQVRVEQSTAGMGQQVVVTDYEKMTGMLLMDFLGNKVAMTMPKEDLEAAAVLGKECKTTYKKESKDIAGLKCKKVLVERADFPSPVTIYFSTKWSNPEMEYGDLKGLPLEITLFKEGIQMKLSATSVQEEAVADIMFEVPEDYEVVTADDLMELFGQ